MKNKIIAGVYKITNEINGKLYIGSSYDLEGRYIIHKRELLKNEHHSKKLQNAWNKYKKERFNFEIIHTLQFAEIFNKEELRKELVFIEQLYLNALLFANEDNNKFQKLGYNIRRVASSSLGATLTSEQKANASFIRKGKYAGDSNSMYGRSLYSLWTEKYGTEEANKRQEERNFKNSQSISGEKNHFFGKRNEILINSNIKRAKIICQYDIKLVLIKEWKSMGDLVRELKSTYVTLKNYCINNKVYKNEFIFKFKNEKDITFQKTKNIRKDCKAIIQVDLCGNILKEWKSLSEAEKLLKITRRAIKKLCNNNKKTILRFKNHKILNNTFLKFKNNLQTVDF